MSSFHQIYFHTDLLHLMRCLTHTHTQTHMRSVVQWLPLPTTKRSWVWFLARMEIQSPMTSVPHPPAVSGCWVSVWGCILSLSVWGWHANCSQRSVTRASKLIQWWHYTAGNWKPRVWSDHGEILLHTQTVHLWTKVWQHYSHDSHYDQTMVNHSYTLRLNKYEHEHDYTIRIYGV